MTLNLTGHIESLGFVGDKPATYRMDKYDIGDRVVFRHDPKEKEFEVIDVYENPADSWINLGHTQMIKVKYYSEWVNGAKLFPN